MHNRGRSLECNVDLVLPTTSAGKSLLEAELANVQYPTGEHPNMFFARIYAINSKLRMVDKLRNRSLMSC